MAKDWVGNKAATFATLAASNHSNYKREERDFYATEPKALELLLEQCNIQLDNNILEPSAGNGALSEVLKKRGYNVTSMDIVERDYPLDGTWDFLETDIKWYGDVVMNPPYRNALEHIEKALDIISDGNKVYAFLKLQFLEGKARRKFYKTKQLKRVFISSSRLNCANNGNFDRYKSSAVAYAWFEFVKGYRGKTVLEWFN